MKVERIAVLCSTGASVLQTSLTACPEVRLDLLLTDRECGVQDVGAQHGTKVVQVDGATNLALSDAFLDVLEAHKIDVVISFYTRLLCGRILQAYADRILNFHPSLLPACPGMHGFEDTMASGALVFGSTVHFVDDGIDTGSPLMQSFGLVDPGSRNERRYRHEVFAQQVGMLSQLLVWLREGRMRPEARYITAAPYGGPAQGFQPALENVGKRAFHHAIALYEPMEAAQ